MKKIDIAKTISVYIAAFICDETEETICFRTPLASQLQRGSLKIKNPLVEFVMAKRPS